MTLACLREEGRLNGDCTGRMAQVTLGHLGSPDFQAWYSPQLQLWVETSQSLGPPAVRVSWESHQGSAVFMGRLSPLHVSISPGALLKAEVDQRQPRKFRNCFQTLRLASVRFKNLCG